MLNARLTAFSSLLKILIPLWTHQNILKYFSWFTGHSFLSIVQIQMKQLVWWTAVQYITHIITWVSFSMI